MGQIWSVDFQDDNMHYFEGGCIFGTVLLGIVLKNILESSRNGNLKTDEISRYDKLEQNLLVQRLKTILESKKGIFFVHKNNLFL